jgi:hypothetical protein
MESYTVDSNGKEVSFAKRCCELLSDQDRRFGAKSEVKSNKREVWQKLGSRFYTVSKYRIDGEVLPIENTAFKIVDGFDKPTYHDDNGKKKVTTKNGIQDHYHFYMGYEFPQNTVAVRRIPCSCDACHTQITLPWDHEADLNEQDRFQAPVNCKLGDEFGDLNEWKFVTLKPKPGECVDDEIQACIDDALQIIEAEMIPKLKSQHYAAINCDDEQSDGYYLVQWEGHPFVLQESMKVEGCKGEMPEGREVFTPCPSQPSLVSALDHEDGSQAFVQSPVCSLPRYHIGEVHSQQQAYNWIPYISTGANGTIQVLQGAPERGGGHCH